MYLYLKVRALIALGNESILFDFKLFVRWLPAPSISILFIELLADW